VVIGSDLAPRSGKISFTVGAQSQAPTTTIMRILGSSTLRTRLKTEFKQARTTLKESLNTGFDALKQGVANAKTSLGKLSSPPRKKSNFNKVVLRTEAHARRLNLEKELPDLPAEAFKELDPRLQKALPNLPARDLRRLEPRLEPHPFGQVRFENQSAPPDQNGDSGYESQGASRDTTPRESPRQSPWLSQGVFTSSPSGTQGLRSVPETPTKEGVSVRSGERSPKREGTGEPGSANFRSLGILQVQTVVNQVPVFTEPAKQLTPQQVQVHRSRSGQDELDGLRKSIDLGAMSEIWNSGPGGREAFLDHIAECKQRLESASRNVLDDPSHQELRAGFAVVRSNLDKLEMFAWHNMIGISESLALLETAAPRLKSDETREAVLTELSKAREKLARSIELNARIDPNWRHFSRMRAAQARVRGELDSVQRLAEGMQKATANPPRPRTVWEDVQQDRLTTVWNSPGGPVAMLNHISACRLRVESEAKAAAGSGRARKDVERERARMHRELDRLERYSMRHLPDMFELTDDMDTWRRNFGIDDERLAPANIAASLKSREGAEELLDAVRMAKKSMAQVITYEILEQQTAVDQDEMLNARSQLLAELDQVRQAAQTRLEKMARDASHGSKLPAQRARSAVPPYVRQMYDDLNLKLRNRTTPCVTEDGEILSPARLVGTGGFNAAFEVGVAGANGKPISAVFKALNEKDESAAGYASGIPPEDPQFAQRNIATVAYANALGAPIVVDTKVAVVSVPSCAGALSEPRLGLIMEKAKGKLAGHRHPDTLDHPEVTRKATWLQLLDALTGQGDRSPANYLIDIGPDGHVDLRGIDNDLCFGASILHPNQLVVGNGMGDIRGVHLPAVVDEEMAAAVTGMTEDTVDGLLKGGFTDGEVAAAKSRLRAVQEHIRGLYGSGQVIACDDWAEKADQYLTPQNNYAKRDKVWNEWDTLPVAA
jgi:hypothetical protein